MISLLLLLSLFLLLFFMSISNYSNGICPQCTFLNGFESLCCEMVCAFHPIFFSSCVLFLFCSVFFLAQCYFKRPASEIPVDDDFVSWEYDLREDDNLSGESVGVFLFLSFVSFFLLCLLLGRCFSSFRHYHFTRH